MLAAIDLGSNSFRLLIGKERDGVIEEVTQAREPNRIASGVDENLMLTDDAIANAYIAIVHLREIMNQYPIKEIRAVATNTFRIAKNTDVFIQEAQKILRCPIRVVSGHEEGRLIYLGVNNMLADKNEDRLVIDIGGGSTELIYGRGDQIIKIHSFAVGTVKQAADYFEDYQVKLEFFEAAINHAHTCLKDAIEQFKHHHYPMVYGSSGTLRAIAEVIEQYPLGDGRCTLENLNLLKHKMCSIGHVSDIDLRGIKQKRTTSVIGGLSILIALFNELSLHEMHPINAGLRKGLLVDYLQNK